MNLTQFFIGRPIFAGVLSALIFLAGLIALPLLPVSEYPEVVPPTVVVRATYPGANPKVIGETVASPLEQSINGVEGMLYQSSQATADGVMTLTVTFALGTDIDKAQVQVQNRVAQVLPKLPEVVQRLGVVTNKASPDLTMVVHLVSPDNRYDTLYLSNYALLRVKDELARLDGVGDVQVFGAGQFSMRIWLDPEKIASRELTAQDVIRAIREQNIQVAAGQLGAPPVATATDFQLAVNAKGRLTTEDDFRNIVVKTGPEGQVTRLRDVARVELGSESYALRALLDNRSAAAIPIFQRPGSNAIAISDHVRAKMAELRRDFPEGVDYQIVYDPTVFVRGSIEAVVHTLFEALLLVVIVVIVFLQTWRASVIPLIAVPVSLVGTFAVMHVFGFSLNALSLFGLVLAIGIVVDDAIVVVENVERNISNGLTPIEATRQAMREVTGPIIATALVLCAVFVPTAFISGLSGQFYKQFALTIAISTVISAFNSLTLSPALAALLLKEHGAEPDRLTRVMNRLLGGFFRPFNRLFGEFSGRYVGVVGRVLRAGGIALFVYGGLIALTYAGFARTPAGFVPSQDKQYLVGFAQLPDAATLDRTEAVVRRMDEIALRQPGVEHAVAFPGLSINGFTNSPNSGIVFVTLKPFAERRGQELSAGAIAMALNQQYSRIQDAYIAMFPPPPVMGLGTVGGFRLQVEDRSGLGFEELYRQTQNLIGKGRQDPALQGLFSSYQVNVPKVAADVDREKAKSQGVSVQDLFDTMQVYLGSLYVNDFNAFGRTYSVTAQAEPGFRLQAEDIVRLKTRNAAGDMIPLGSFVTVHPSSGPDRVHANRLDRASRAGEQERHPDRRVRPRSRAARRDAARGDARRGATAAAADSHDVARVHPRRRAARDLGRCRCRNASRHGHRGLLRDDRRHGVWPGTHPALLSGDPADHPAAARVAFGACAWADLAVTPAARRGAWLSARGGVSSPLSAVPAMNARRLLLTVAPALLLAACAVGPDYREPPMPAVTIANAAAPGFAARNPASTWWQEFADTELDRLVQRALAANLDIRGAVDRVLEARAVFVDRRLDYAPHVRLDGAYTRSEAQVPGFGPDRIDVRSASLGFDATWEIDLFGHVRRSVEAARADLGAEEANLRDVQVTVAAEVARNYFEMRGVQKRLSVAHDNLRSAQQTLDLTQLREEAGRGSALDVESSRARLKSTEATLPILESAEKQLGYRLAVLLGEPPGAIDQELGAAPVAPHVTELPIGDPTALLRQRPDVRAAERELAAATARVGIATADLFPRVSVTGFVGFLSGDVSQLFGTTAKNDARAWSVTPSVSWAAFDLGLVAARLRASKAQADAAAARYEKAVLTALEDTESSFVSLSKRQVQLRSLGEQAAASRRAAELADLQYREGSADFLVLLDAQRTQLEAEDALAQSETAVNVAVVAIYKALGGIGQPSPGVPGTVPAASGVPIALPCASIP